MRLLLPTILLTVVLAPASALGQDDGKFSAALLKTARDGNARAQNDLAIAYSEGIGVRPDQRKAVYWFRQSAEQGYVYGACNLGVHYGHGLGIRKDRVEATKWSFIAHSLDGLRCHPGDFIESFKISECQVEEAWGQAVAWLRAHPELENRNYGGGRPWMEEDGEDEYRVTARENGPRVQLPVKPSLKCKPSGRPARSPRKAAR
jgi:TPR repeat protein